MFEKWFDQMIKVTEYVLSVVACALVMNIWVW